MPLRILHKQDMSPAREVLLCGIFIYIFFFLAKPVIIKCLVKKGCYLRKFGEGSCYHKMSGQERLFLRIFGEESCYRRIFGKGCYLRKFGEESCYHRIFGKERLLS